MPMEEGTAWMVRGRGGDSRRRGGKVAGEGGRLTLRKGKAALESREVDFEGGRRLCHCLSVEVRVLYPSPLSPCPSIRS